MSGRLESILARACLAAVALLICGLGWQSPAHAQRLENGTAVFAALDKVTAAVQKITAKLNDTEAFRTLRITPRVCYTRAPTEPPRTSTFVEIDEIMFDGKEKRIFTGWMFAESPGLNPMLHPVFDVWLTGCAQPLGAPVAKGPQPPPAAGGPVAPQPPAEPPRRRRAPR
jgi:hypothetical protein